MQLDEPWPLLGGLTPRQFMRRHWQKRPLLVRQAWPGVQPPLARERLFELAARDDVESRLLVQDRARKPAWRLRHGPFARRSLPALKRPHWTLLVQGADLHDEAAHAMLARFRFVPDARLDDLMISYASDGGGVGPHLDSYDVFLLQVHGRRRWRIGRVRDERLVDGLPVRILRNFEPEEEWVLEPGDMLYLPPRWGHDGIAVGECMTCSIGFSVPTDAALASDLLGRLAESEGESEGRARLYRDAREAATAHPARIPEALLAFAQRAVAARLRRKDALPTVLGEWLTEPKPKVWFEPGRAWHGTGALVLDRRTRMMYDSRCVFINGESYRAAGRDAHLLARLADTRQLGAAEVARLGTCARQLLGEWVASGWMHAKEEPSG